MTRLLLLLLLALSLVACPGDGELADDDDTAASDDDDAATDDDDATPPGNQEEVTITTTDGLTLHGTWRAPANAADVPAVLLLHQYARNRGDFGLLHDGFAEAGLATLAIDFRSHGDSDDAPVAFGDLLTDPTQLPVDASSALEWIAARSEVDATRVGVLGLSVGANVAVVANHNRAAWGVKSTASVSTNLDRVYDLAGTTTLDLAGAIYVAADLEQPQADMADELGALTADPVDVRRVLNTSSHGVDLLTASAGVRDGVVDWFVENL